MAERIDTPVTLTGKPEEQLKQIWSYLYRTAEQLNNAMNNLTISDFVVEDQAKLSSAGSSTEIDKTAQTLKSMIIKTAEIVRSEMDEISTQLRSEYNALSSQFGTYEQTIDSRITATAEGVVQSYNYESRIDGLETQDGKFNQYITSTDNYIFTGIIGYKTDGTPITGMAIGEGITTIQQDGTKVINNERKVATFTADKLSFWQNGVEVAYFSNNSLKITEAEILGKLKMGNYRWQILTDGSMGLTTSGV